MSLRPSIRRAVRVARRSVRSIEVLVRHDFGVTRSASGAITYQHSELRRAIVEPTTQIFRDAAGSARASRASVTFLYYCKVDLNNLILLPSGETGPILRISEGVADPENVGGGGFITRLLLG